MAEDNATISNQNFGDTSGPVVQVGAVYGDVRIHTEPSRPGDPLLVSVTCERNKNMFYDYDDGRRSRHPDVVVRVFVEAFSARAVILHRLRPVIVRRIDRYYPYPMPSEISGEWREFRVTLEDLPKPMRCDAGLDTQELRLERASADQTNDFPFYVAVVDRPGR